MRIGSRALAAICGALVVLLAALAVVQYRWSTRVAAADAQREKEHLESAASLFATEFDGMLSQAVRFLQNDGYTALRSHRPLAGTSPMFAAVYYAGAPVNGMRDVRRLTADGQFAPSPKPDWLTMPHCSALIIDSPPALVAPIYDISTTETHDPAGNHILKTYRSRTDDCFVALLDQAYLRNRLLPQLIRQSFGQTAAGEYNFAVVPLDRPDHPVYGGALRPDLRKTFFSVVPEPLLPPNISAERGNPQPAFLIRRFSTKLGKELPGFDGPGVWELQIAHKGVPLAIAFEQVRRRNLLLGAGIEALLIAAILFLVIATRRMQSAAAQQMLFVAGVSHELRTPVSAIAMLSRNQADGLVAGVEKVKQYGELIHQQARRLNEMVEETLLYAGIHSGLRKTTADQVDVAALIRDVVDARREDLTRRGFDVKMALAPDLPLVTGDAKLLRTAFDNLLDNTLKHAGAGRWIRITAIHAVSDKELRITIEDRGAGIPAKDQSDIFEPFCRGSAAVEAQIPGSGLGLSLVRSAAEAHHGAVTLVSEPGRGSAFTMHLPV